MDNLINLYKNPKFNQKIEAYYLEKQCSLTRGKLTEDFCELDLENCFECPVTKYYPKAKKELIEFFLNEPFF